MTVSFFEKVFVNFPSKVSITTFSFEGGWKFNLWQSNLDLFLVILVVDNDDEDVVLTD